MTNSNEKKYSIVFDGQYIDNKDIKEIQHEFKEKFGEKTADIVFSEPSVTLKKNLSKEEAIKVYQLLKKIGMLPKITNSQASTDISKKMAPTQHNVVASTPERKVNPDLSTPISNSKPITSIKKDRKRLDNTSNKHDSSKPKKLSTYTISEIDAAFSDGLELPTRSKLYLANLIPVSIVMILLPILYIALTVLCFYGVYWVSVNGYTWILDSNGRNDLSLRALITIPSVIALFALGVFLARPIISNPNNDPQPVRLDPNREKTLFHLVKSITTAIGAPMPSEIRVDTQVNASAMLTNGVFSKNLTLTIGLPLLYGMNVQTLTAILAHEFGHFTQGVGMRLTYTIVTINRWLYRKSFERDPWDDYVEEYLEDENSFIALSALLAKFGSWICRIIFKLLAYFAQMLCASLTRQMEFDADRYEIALLGSTQYRKTAIQLRVLSQGSFFARNELEQALANGKYADNLPKLIADKAASFTKQDINRIAAGIDDVNRNIFDSHPADNARIKRAFESNLEPKFNHTGSAQNLIKELERLSKLSTLQWYRFMGIDVSPDDLTSLGSIQDTIGSQKRLNASKLNYLKEFCLTTQPMQLLLTKELKHHETEELKLKLDQLVNDNSYQYELAQLIQQKADNEQELTTYKEVSFWLTKGYSVNQSDYNIEEFSTISINKKIEVLEEKNVVLKNELNKIAKYFGERVSLALEILSRQLPEFQEEIYSLKRSYFKLAKCYLKLEELSKSSFLLKLYTYEYEQVTENDYPDPSFIKERKRNTMLQDQVSEKISSILSPSNNNQSFEMILEKRNQNHPDEETTLQDGYQVYQLAQQFTDEIEGRMVELVQLIEKRP